MTKITWLGEDTEEYAGPSFNVWNGIKFPKGQAVEVADPQMIAKAKGNRFYKVEEAKHVEEGKEGKEGQEEKEQEQAHPHEIQKTGYAPVKKKVRKKKDPGSAAPDPIRPPADA